MPSNETTVTNWLKEFEQLHPEVRSIVDRFADKKSTVDERRIAFYAAIGYCITEWAHLEDRLFAIFRGAMGCTVEQGAITYYRTPSVETRLQLTSELVLSVLPQKVRPDGGKDHPSVAEWNEVKNSIADLLATRRRIAHHPVWTIKKEGEGEEESWFEIAIGEIEKLRRRDTKTAPLNIYDLIAHWILIGRAEQKLSSFYISRLLVLLAEHR